jgi:tRNA(fMet)-specific endonuclease VapC
VTLWILDTDHLSLLQRSHPTVVQRFNEKRPEEVAVTVITVYEQLRGWLKAVSQASTPAKLQWAYAGLWNAVQFFQWIQVIQFDAEAIDRYKSFTAQERRAGTQDLQIAAIVLVQDAILATRNHRDFRQVAELLLEDWTVDSSDSY